MSRRAIILALLLLSGFLTGCAGPKAAWRSEKGNLVRDAERYISELRAQDKLPGVSSGEHGRLTAAVAGGEDGVKYPATVTVQLWKQGEASPYNYDLQKDEPQASWRLTSATRLDENGHVVEELPLK